MGSASATSEPAPVSAVSASVTVTAPASGAPVSPKQESAKTNRRERTMARYADALMGLCETRDLSAVSVTDLVEAAGTVRQTFYNYFTDINDLICFTAFRPMRALVAPIADMRSMRATCEQIAARRAFFSQLARQTGQNNFWDALAQWLFERYVERYAADDPADADADARLDAADDAPAYGLPADGHDGCDERDYRRACLELYCAGSAALLRKWCAQGVSVAPETVADTQFDMLPEFVKRDLSRLPSGAADADGYPR